MGLLPKRWHAIAWSNDGQVGVLSCYQLTMLPQSEGSELDPHLVHDNLCHSIKIKRTKKKMYTISYQLVKWKWFYCCYINLTEVERQSSWLLYHSARVFFNLAGLYSTTDEINIHIGVFQISNSKCAKSQNYDVSHLDLPLSLPNPLMPGVKLRMKM